LLTSAGLPLLYYGDEVARPGGAWPDNRPDMPWALAEDPANATLALTRELIALRRAHSALTRGSYAPVEAHDGLLAFAREWQGERLVVAVNRGPDAATLACPAAECALLLCWQCQSDAAGLALPAHSAAVLATTPPP
jgi:alpha-amylase